MNTIIRKSVYLLLATFFFAFAFACSSNDDKSGLEANLLDYDEVNMITFTISGNAVCQKCQEEETPIEMMQLEVYVKGDSLNRLAIKLYGGIGQFSIPNVVAESGATLKIEGKLFRQGTSGYVTAYYGYGEVDVPDKEDAVVSLTLKFPSSESEN